MNNYLILSPKFFYLESTLFLHACMHANIKVFQSMLYCSGLFIKDLMCMSVLPTYVILPTYTYVRNTGAPGAIEGQKQASDLLELELWMIVNKHVGART